MHTPGEHCVHLTSQLLTSQHLLQRCAELFVHDDAFLAHPPFDGPATHMNGAMEASQRNCSLHSACVHDPHDDGLGCVGVGTLVGGAGALVGQLAVAQHAPHAVLFTKKPAVAAQPLAP